MNATSQATPVIVEIIAPCHCGGAHSVKQLSQDGQTSHDRIVFESFEEAYAYADLVQNKLGHRAMVHCWKM